MKRHLNTSTIIATLALFFSLGGASLAAGHYLITSTHQIKPSVLHQLIRPQRPASPTGAQGPVGPQGPAGAVGATGAFDAGSLTRAQSATTTCAAGQAACVASARCPVGTSVVSGGLNAESDKGIAEDTSIVDDEPYQTTGWQIILTNNATTPMSFRAIALCG